MATKLTTHQQEVFEAIVGDIKENLFSFHKSNDITDHLLSLTGAAGVGKSFITAHITKVLTTELQKQNYYHNEGIILTAPTHKAVKVLKEMLKIHNITAECRTIHSFLDIKPIHDYDTGEEKFTVIRHKQSPPSKASLLIVDESSMVSSELYDFIIEAVKRGKANTILFIGDPNQLLPVNHGENNIFKLKKQYKLTEIVRQARDSDIIKLATKIRNRIENQDFVDLKDLFKDEYGKDIEFFTKKDKFIKSYYKNSEWYAEDKILASYTNKDVDGFNTLIRNQYWKEKGISQPKFFLANDMIRFKSALNIEIISMLNLPQFQNGEEVMLEKAEFIHHQKSGLKFWKCTVVGRNENNFFRVIDPDNTIIFNNKLEEYVHLAKSSRFPYSRLYWKKYFQLKSAFADVQYIFSSTIHKLQGSSYDTAHIDLASLINNKQISDDLKYRLAYVAITRARSNIKILL